MIRFDKDDRHTIYVWAGFEEHKIVNVHDESQCEHRACVVHNPSDHHMKQWPLHWRDDRTIFERICSHGVGHPDPDQIPFWKETGQLYQATHGCDLCCRGGS